MPRREEFTKKTKREAWERAGGKCEGCGVKLRGGGVEYDHEIECARGGDNSLENCVALCPPCHRAKTKRNAPVVAKTRRQSDKHKGIRKPSQWGNGNLKRKLDGTVVDRETGQPV